MSRPSDPVQDYFDSLLNDKPLEGKPLDKDSLNLHSPDDQVLPVDKPKKYQRANLPHLEDVHIALKAAEQYKLQKLLDENISCPLEDSTNLDDTKTIDTLPANSLCEPEPSCAENEIKNECTDLQSEAITSESPLIDVDRCKNLSRLLEWNDNGRPVWAQERFDALLFQVSGLTLAVPLVALGQIVNLSDKLTPIFGQSDWFMGLLPTPIGKLKTVNTALFVMPERYKPSFLKTAKYVISFDGQPWGLAVDSVTQPVILDPSDVSWRGVRSSRPWLAGTVKSSMCALIDIPQMAKLLNQEGKVF